MVLPWSPVSSHMDLLKGHLISLLTRQLPSTRIVIGEGEKWKEGDGARQQQRGDERLGKFKMKVWKLLSFIIYPLKWHIITVPKARWQMNPGALWMGTTKECEKQNVGFIVGRKDFKD